MLCVWLPLNGDLHNQGLNNITITNNGATIDNNGKIGKCYYFNGTNARLSLPSYILDYPISICAWIKGETITDTTTEYIFSYNTASGGTAGHKIGFGTYQGKLTIWQGGSTASYNTALENNKWYHIAAIVTTTSYILYLNGIPVITNNRTMPTVDSEFFTIGARSNATGGGVNGASYYFKGYINDVRIYNHALSAKEVEEIAKGLVLHYKLDDRFCESTTNLCSTSTSGWNNSGTCNRISNNTSIPNPPTPGAVYSVTATSDGNMALTAGQTPASHPSKTIIASAYVWLDGVQDTSVFYLRSSKTDGSVGNLMYNGNSNPTTWPLRQWIRIATVPITTASGATTFYICTYLNKNTEVRAINGWQIEEKDHITPWVAPGTTRTATTVYDSSGYNNNGTIVGSLETTTPSPRYGYAMKFDGSSYIKKTDFQIGNIWSLSCWFYSPSSSNNKWSPLIILNNTGGDSDSKFSMYYNQTTGVLQYQANGQYDTTQTTTKDNWHHMVATFNGNTLIGYLDGVQKISKSITNAELIKTNLCIGARCTGTNFSSVSVPFYGKLSDARIYATALTAEQVADLYRTSMAIDNQGNIHARELVEL